MYDAACGSGSRATPNVCGDNVYTFGAMGDLLCLDSASRAHIIEPDLPSVGSGGRKVVWSHPVFGTVAFTCATTTRYCASLSPRHHLQAEARETASSSHCHKSNRLCCIGGSLSLPKHQGFTAPSGAVCARGWHGCPGKLTCASWESILKWRPVSARLAAKNLSILWRQSDASDI